MWIAPNMVTLLGFMWIVGNVFLIEIFMPDLEGPVRALNVFYSRPLLNTRYRALGGCTLASHWACGCQSNYSHESHWQKANIPQVLDLG